LLSSDAVDEPTTGLDPEARRETWALIESIRDSGVTVTRD
jgi:ABC-2 type transport system ATP-binding protein